MKIDNSKFSFLKMSDQYRRKIVEDLLLKEDLAPFPHHSRVHKLHTFSDEKKQVYIKREDELGFCISGSKVRKYLSLLPFLQKYGCDEAVLIGSAHSNHVLGLSQLLVQYQIRPILFLLEPGDKTKKGNFLFTSLFVPKSDIYWIERKEWNNVLSLGREYILKRSSEGVRAQLIPEGGLMPESFLGALTLPLDICRNQREMNCVFDHFFIDAGTGLTAIASILGLSYLHPYMHIHVIVMASTKAIFLDTLKEYHAIFVTYLGQSLPFPSNFSLYYPQNARSFGSVNHAVIETIKEMAQKEGVLLDPIYNAKLITEAKHIIPTIEGNILLTHSGGGLSLIGYLDKLL